MIDLALLGAYRRLYCIMRLQVRAFTSSAIRSAMQIVPVPVREDNYAYLLIDESSKQAAAVDPYDVGKVIAAAEKLGSNLEHIPLTPVLIFFSTP